MEHGAGTTFVALALSNFLCSKLGKKTAYVELNTTNQICSLSGKLGNEPFSYLGIRAFPCTTVTSLSEILSMDFDYFVLDMGILNAYTAKEFSKCNKRFIVCSLSEWKKDLSREKIEDLLSKINLHQDHVTVIGNLNAEKSRSSIFPMGHQKLLSFPFIENPFRLTPDVFSVFYRILERQI